MALGNNVNFTSMDEEKEVFVVLEASVENGKEVNSEILGIYENKEELMKNRRKYGATGHKTVVKANMKLEAVEYMGSIDKL